MTFVSGTTDDAGLVGEPTAKRTAAASASITGPKANSRRKLTRQERRRKKKAPEVLFEEKMRLELSALYRAGDEEREREMSGETRDGFPAGDGRRRRMNTRMMMRMRVRMRISRSYIEMAHGTMMVDLVAMLVVKAALLLLRSLCVRAL